jgi:lincosamide nucleotidyltransferase A/C/D/E
MNFEVTAEAAADLAQLFASAGIDVWLDGGWAVDAAVGRQTRPHKDLDIILRKTDLPRLHEVLEPRGFRRKDGGTTSNFVLQDGSGREVDVHGVEFDVDGNGVYRMENGLDWIFPAEGFAGRGEIDGVPVRCLTPLVQVLCHAHGYVPTEKDFKDMELLEAQFGVELPPQLRRNP